MPRKTGVAEAVASGKYATSMRPRPDAAENRGAGGLLPGAPRNFNEAAARCRGKPGAGQ